MVGYRYLILSLVVLLTSCAQIGTITGGEVDMFAPKPVENKVSPPNGTTNFSTKEVEIPFDEYFKLIDPNINIRIVPSHAKIESRTKGKSLFLSWEEELQENTTYAIYLNNAVVDVNEGNDTIIQYVFSTGSILDTLKFNVSVVNAWSGDPEQECLVGLFDPETNELRSFAETNEFGIATLNYLQAGDYKAIAFKDENGDLEVQDHELVGFPLDHVVSVQPLMLDTVRVRLYAPLQDPEIRSARFAAPGSFLIGTSRELLHEDVYINDQKIDPIKYALLDIDSLQIFADLTDVTSANIVLKSEYINDTVTVRFTSAEKQRPITVTCKNPNNTFTPSEQIEFVVNDFIESVDTALITVFNQKDSVEITEYSVSFAHNRLIIELDKTDLGILTVSFKEGTIKTTSGENSLYESIIVLNPERKYGTLNLDLEGYTSPIVLHVFNNHRVVKVLPIESPTKDYLINELTPGDYTFKVIRDVNNNGVWDVGNIKTSTQPELVDSYSTVSKVRANWQIEITLIPIE